MLLTKIYNYYIIVNITFIHIIKRLIQNNTKMKHLFPKNTG